MASDQARRFIQRRWGVLVVCAVWVNIFGYLIAALSGTWFAPALVCMFPVSFLLGCAGASVRLVDLGEKP